MKVRAVPSAPGDDQTRQFLTTFVIDDVLAIDAGGLGLWDRPDRHAAVRDVFITHRQPVHRSQPHEPRSPGGQVPEHWQAAKQVVVLQRVDDRDGSGHVRSHRRQPLVEAKGAEFAHVDDLLGVAKTPSFEMRITFLP